MERGLAIAPLLHDGLELFEYGEDDSVSVATTLFQKASKQSRDERIKV